MLIDWVTMRIPSDRLTPDARERLSSICDRLICYDPGSGHVHYDIPRWESVRSDSHQIAVRFASDLWVQGSPARVLGDGDTVFGSGASLDLNLKMCVHAMSRYVAGKLNINLPWATEWTVSRVDVTQNFALDSLDQVLSALSILARTSGGRYRVSSVHGDTVYYSQRSRLRAGKGYSKGRHLQYLSKTRRYHGRIYSAEEIKLCQNILRLELRLGREWFRRHLWSQVTPEDLREEFHSYFDRIIGGSEVGSTEDLKRRMISVADTEGQGRAAYGLWLLIQHEGWEVVRQNTPKSTWYRSLKVFRKSGLSDADISAGRVVEIRRKIIDFRQVNTWQELAA